MAYPNYLFDTLAAVTNGTDGTYYYYLNMDNFKYAAIQCTLSGGTGTVTVTVEGSVQNEQTNSSAIYQDITSSFFGVASITATGMFVIDTPTSFKWVRVKVVASTAAVNDADWTIYAKRLN